MFSSNQNIGEGESNFDDKYVETSSKGFSAIKPEMGILQNLS